MHSSTPKFTSHAHEKGLNFVDHFSRDDMLYLLSGSNDYTAKVWAEAVVTAICAHPNLPIVITGSEEETLRIWDANGFGA